MFSSIFAAIKSYQNPRHWVKNVTWRFPRTVSQKKVVFVVGAPRSGTTLLQRVLSLHPDLFSIEGETGLFTKQNIFAPERQHFGLSTDLIEQLFLESRDIVDFFNRGLDHLVEDNPAARFVEKTPQHVFQLATLSKRFPQASFIHIVRDGRDCYCSARKMAEIPQAQSITRFAKYWLRCVRSPMQASLGARIRHVKYEDLVRHPEQELGSLMSFLGLAVDPKQLDAGQIGQDHRASVDAFKKLAQPINDGSTQRWQTELSSDENRVFITLAKSGLKEFNYL